MPDVLKVLVTSPNLSVSNALNALGEIRVLGAHERVRPDVLLIPGGVDISPSLYDQGASVAFSNDDRDHSEISQFFAARLARIPIIGICRGMQLMHVLRGGTLIPHVEGHRSTDHNIVIKSSTTKEVQDYFLESPDDTVTSSHHQAVPLTEALKMYDDIGVSDGVAETTVEFAMDKGSKSFGVQFHPEYANASIGCKGYLQLMINLAKGVM